MGACSNKVYEKTGDSVIVKVQHKETGGPRLVRLQVMGDKLIRVSATADSKFADPQSLIVVPQKKQTSFAVVQNGDTITVSTEEVKASVLASTGEVWFTDKNGELILQENKGGGKTFTPIEVESLSRTTERVAHGANAAGSTMTVNGTTAQYSYGVDGWYSGSTRVTSSATYAPMGVTANATYTAKGTRSLRSYTVTYNKGSYISSVSRSSESVSYGSNAAGSTATVMASDAQYTYGFDGWYNGSTRVSTSVTYAPTNITGAVTLEARGTRTTKSYTISVSLDSSAAGRGSVSGGGSYAYGASATVKCTKTNSQDVFDGWYEGSTRVSTSLSYTFTVTGARTLVAKILYLDVTPTSLSYGATGGSQTFKITTNTSWKIS